MALNGKNIKNENSSKFPPQPDLEAGTYPARVVQVLDLGLQPQRPYKGEAKPPKQEIQLTYELLDSFMQDEDGNDIEGKPRWVSETLPFVGLFADKAKSTQRYYALDPDESLGGDFSQLAGMACNVTLVINKTGDKTYTNVANVAQMRARDAAKAPDLVNPTKVFDLDAPDMDVFGALPEWLRDKIKGNLNYEGSKLQEALSSGADPVSSKPAKKAEDKAKPAVQTKEESTFTDEEQDDKPW